MSSKEAVIEISHLHKSFDGHVVLKSIDLTVYKGENVVIIGKSGEGKSVTIKCIVRLVEPDEGVLKVFGEEVTQMNEDALKALRSRIGFLFQGAALYDSMTVRENLAFPLKRVVHVKDKKEIEQRSMEVLEAVGLQDVIDKMPSDLSGGMRKRLGLARTLVVHPEIVLYDEPTTGLDTITSKEISDLILQTQKKYETSSIIITHDIPCARAVADRVVVMHEGRFIAEGTVGTLENSPDPFVQSFFK
jgi:phospholipid/cholesterol/gamma-HCH transport system ATP-binding protein